MRNRIKEIVVSVINEYNEETEILIDLSLDEKTRLFGGGGVLTSLNLVSLVVMVEEAIEDEFKMSISLADEKAMSRRVSPFASLGSLIDYIDELISSN